MEGETKPWPSILGWKDQKPVSTATYQEGGKYNREEIS
jgi:hypothetical protein